MLKKVKSGFSLVELSLVLIIVALIISAVVSGKSLVQNSKLTLLHSEMQTLKIALGNYISDNKLVSFKLGTEKGEINLYNLMDQGYLEDGSVVNYDGTAISATSSNKEKTKKAMFKSKYSGGAWQYAGDANDVKVQFGKVKKADGTMDALLTGAMAKTFQTKYEKFGSIIMNEIDTTEGANKGHGVKYSGGTTVTVLDVHFLDGAQN